MRGETRRTPKACKSSNESQVVHTQQCITHGAAAFHFCTFNPPKRRCLNVCNIANYRLYCDLWERLSQTRYADLRPSKNPNCSKDWGSKKFGLALTTSPMLW